MPNGGPGPINRFNKYYSYRFEWSDGYYTWQNCTRPSPANSSDSEEAVEHKEKYWKDYFRTEICASLRHRRLLPWKLLTHNIYTRIADFLGTMFNIWSDDVEHSSTLPGSALPGSTTAVYLEHVL